MESPRVGMMIRIHPCMDLFMRGVKFAEIEKIGRNWIHVHSHMTNSRHRVSKKGWGVTVIPENEQF